MRLTISTAILIVSALVPGYVLAQEFHDDVSDVVRAEVVRVTEAEQRLIPGTDTEHLYQTVEARLLEGEDVGQIVTVENDFLELEIGDRFFAIHYVFIDGTEQFSVQDIDRRGKVLVLIGLFAMVVIAFGGWYGLRALMSLAVSLAVLMFVLIPGLLGGWNPLIASFLVATFVLAGALFMTHGVNRESTIAFLGTTCAVGVTLVLAAFSVSWADLSGFASEESVSLNFGTRGSIDLVALLVGGIVIGAIGVLDDIAITQVAVVRELMAINATLSRREVFVRAMRVGREHVGAVINTLALAYVGVSLPLMLFMHITPASHSMVVNMEIIATEIVRTVVGSIGIVLAVPIVTLLAVRFLRRRDAPPLVGGREDTPVIHSHY